MNAWDIILGIGIALLVIGAVVRCIRRKKEGCGCGCGCGGNGGGCGGCSGSKSEKRE